MSMWGWEGQQDGTGSEGRLHKAVTQDSTILKANMEANPCCICREKCSSSCVLFFLVVVAILSSVKKPPPPSLQMEPKRLSQFPLLSGEEFAWGQKSSRGREAVETDGWERWLSAFSTWMFFICSSFSLFPPLCLPYLTFSVLPHPFSRLNWEKEASSLLLFFQSPPPAWPLTRKKNPWQKAEMNTNC